MMDYVFEPAPWQLELEALPQGGSISAVRLLALLEEESEESVEEAFLALEMRGITLDISQLSRPAYSGEAAVRLRREESLVQKEDFWLELEENDPLRLYLQELAALPSAGDAQAMAERYASGYEAVLPALTNLMLSRVLESAKTYTGRGVLLLDLIQEGSLGLWQGILSYRSGDFKSHAQWWIDQYLSKAVVLQARSLGLGQKMKQALQDYRQTDERLLMELGRNPTLQEIAEHLHITPQEAATVAGMLSSARSLQQAHKASQEPEESPEDEQHVEDTAYFQSRQRIEEMLSGLTQQQAKILQLRFGLEGGKPMTPEETGRILKLTPEEVVALEAQALSILRNDKS